MQYLTGLDRQEMRIRWGCRSAVSLAKLIPTYARRFRQERLPYTLQHTLLKTNGNAKADVWSEHANAHLLWCSTQVTHLSSAPYFNPLP